LAASFFAPVDPLHPLPPEGLSAAFVRAPPLRIAEDLVRFGELAEACRVAGVLIVRVKALRQQPVDAVDRFRLGVGADLERFVVIGHGALVLRGASSLSAWAELHSS